MPLSLFKHLSSACVSIPPFFPLAFLQGQTHQAEEVESLARQVAQPRFSDAAQILAGGEQGLVVVARLHALAAVVGVLNQPD